MTTNVVIGIIRVKRPTRDKNNTALLHRFSECYLNKKKKENTMECDCRYPKSQTKMFLFLRKASFKLQKRRIIYFG